MRCACQQASNRRATLRRFGSAPLHPETSRVEFNWKAAAAGFAGSLTPFSLPGRDLFFQ
jgi:hypothetical protein